MLKTTTLLPEENSLDDGKDGDIIVAAPTRFPPKPKISLLALIGWTTSKTMRFSARIRQYKVVVLIDSGSTHNFISEKIANLLQLPVIPTEPFNVRVANGSPLKC